MPSLRFDPAHEDPHRRTCITRSASCDYIRSFDHAWMMMPWRILSREVTEILVRSSQPVAGAISLWPQGWRISVAAPARRVPRHLHQPLSTTGIDDLNIMFVTYSHYFERTWLNLSTSHACVEVWSMVVLKNVLQPPRGANV